MGTVEKYTQIQELDRATLMEFIESITVSESEMIDGVKHQSITIRYRFIGEILSQNAVEGTT